MNEKKVTVIDLPREGEPPLVVHLCDPCTDEVMTALRVRMNAPLRSGGLRKSEFLGVGLLIVAVGVGILIGIAVHTILWWLS